MNLFQTPIAEASVVSLVKSINKVVINPIIYFLFALAAVIFLFGLFKYISNPDNENIRKESKSHMMWGIVGLFIMISVFGIMNLILNTVGEKNIKIDNTGDYSVGEQIIK
jgi:uncharacterized membrane protein